MPAMSRILLGACIAGACPSLSSPAGAQSPNFPRPGDLAAIRNGLGALPAGHGQARRHGHGGWNASGTRLGSGVGTGSGNLNGNGNVGNFNGNGNSGNGNGNGFTSDGNGNGFD